MNEMTREELLELVEALIQRLEIEALGLKVLNEEINKIGVSLEQAAQKYGKVNK